MILVRSTLGALIVLATLAACTSAAPAPTVSPGATAATLNKCGAELATPPARTEGLRLTAEFEHTDVSDDQIAGTVTLTNDTSSRVTGTTAATPIVTLSRNGMVLWHTNGAMIAMAVEVDLAPGQSMRYPAGFSPVQCSAKDESAPSFPSDLPTLPVGRYDVSAAIDLTGADGQSTLITGPLTRIRLG